MDIEKWTEIKDKINSIKINIKDGDGLKVYEALGLSESDVDLLDSLSKIFKKDSIVDIADVVCSDIHDTKMLTVIALSLAGRRIVNGLRLHDAIIIGTSDPIDMANIYGVEPSVIPDIVNIDTSTNSYIEAILEYDKLYEKYDRKTVFASLYVYYEFMAIRELLSKHLGLLN